MLNKTIEELEKREQIEHLRMQARNLEVEIENNQRTFERKVLDLQEINWRINELNERMKWDRFTAYCATSCWRYRVR